MLSAIAASTGALRDVDVAERRQSKRDAVRDSESSDGLDQLPAAAGDDNQREHEQEMVNARQDVLDAEHGIRAGDANRSLPGPQPQTTERTA